jgi:ClpP class serine protease
MDAILEALASYGIAGIFLAVLVYYLNKLTDIHREERKEWQDANNQHVDKFSEVIAENTKALTEMRSELKENRCKM